jgi:hypothetical protein
LCSMMEAVTKTDARGEEGSRPGQRIRRRKDGDPREGGALSDSQHTVGAYRFRRGCLEKVLQVRDGHRRPCKKW